MNTSIASSLEKVRPRADRERVPIAGIIRQAVKLCYGNPREFLVMAAVAGIPPAVLSLLVMAQDPKNRMSPGQGMIGLISLCLGIASFVLLMYYIGSVPLLTAHAVAGRPMSWTEAFAWIRERELFWGVFLALLLTGLAAIGGLVLLIVPCFIFAAWYMLSVPARVLGNLPGKQALSESKRLVEPALWGSIGLGVLLVLPMLIATLGTQIAFGLTYGFFSNSPGRVVTPAVVTFVTAVFWGPVSIIGLTLYYLQRSGGLKAQRADLFL